MRRNTFSGWAGFALLVPVTSLLFLLSLGTGSVSIPVSEILEILFGNEASVKHSVIVWELRIPRSVTALLAGSALSVSGLMMQTLFRNPVAGPFVLGVSSGAGLGVALLVLAISAFPVLGSFWLFQQFSLAFAAVFGAVMVLGLMLLIARRVQDVATLLIIGLMLGSLFGAIIGLLQFFAMPEAVKMYIVWTFGSLSSVNLSQLPLFVGIVLAGLLFSWSQSRNLDGFLLGEEQAKSLGIAVEKARFMVILVTGILAGTVTAFCGPIAFIGIAIPHFARMWVDSRRHFILLPATAVSGGAALLLCDLLSHWVLPEQTLPINSVTAILGAPVVIWLVVRNKNINRSFQ